MIVVELIVGAVNVVIVDAVEDKFVIVAFVEDKFVIVPVVIVILPPAATKFWMYAFVPVNVVVTIFVAFK